MKKVLVIDGAWLNHSIEMMKRSIQAAKDYPESYQDGSLRMFEAELELLNEIKNNHSKEITLPTEKEIEVMSEKFNYPNGEKVSDGNGYTGFIEGCKAILKLIE